MLPRAFSVKAAHQSICLNHGLHTWLIVMHSCFATPLHGYPTGMLNQAAHPCSSNALLVNSAFLLPAFEASAQTASILSWVFGPKTIPSLAKLHCRMVRRPAFQRPRFRPSRPSFRTLPKCALGASCSCLPRCWPASSPLKTGQPCLIIPFVLVQTCCHGRDLDHHGRNPDCLMCDAWMQMLGWLHCLELVITAFSCWIVHLLHYSALRRHTCFCTTIRLRHHTIHLLAPGHQTRGRCS